MEGPGGGFKLTTFACKSPKKVEKRTDYYYFIYIYFLDYSCSLLFIESVSDNMSPCYVADAYIQQRF